MKSNYYTVHKNKTPKLVVKNRRQRRLKILARSVDSVYKKSKEVVEKLEQLQKANRVISMPPNSTFRFVTMRSDRQHNFSKKKI